MGIQPSASKSDLLLQCPRPFDPETVIDPDDLAPGKEAIWGIIAHANLATAVGLRYKVYSSVAVVKMSGDQDHLRWLPGVTRCLYDWLDGDNPWDEKFEIVHIETHLEVIFNRDGQVLKAIRGFDEATHTYALHSKHGMGATPDLVVRGCDTGVIVVLDLKTGDYIDTAKHPSEPEKWGQLLTLAAAYGAGGVAILRAPKDGVPVVYASSVTAPELVTHAKKMRRALRLVGSGYMKPGPECRWCPARHDCPARMGDRIKHTAALVRAAGGVCDLRKVSASEVNLGAFLQGGTRLVTLLKEAREEIKEQVRDGLVIETDDGKVYQLGTHERRNLSMASIKRALGPLKGEAEIAKLTKLGAVEISEYEDLRAK